MTLNVKTRQASVIKRSGMLFQGKNHPWERLKRGRYKIAKFLPHLPLLKPVVESLASGRYHQRLLTHQPHLPELERLQDRMIVEQLQKSGTHITSLDALELPNTQVFWQTGRRLVRELREMSISPETHYIDLPQERLMDFPEMFLWGLETRLLNIAENYIGLPVLYHGCSIRWDRADAVAGEGIRQWHMDWEDERVLKLIIYFNDVDIHGGCYNYIPKSLSQKAARSLKYDLGFVSDSAMADVLPREQWWACPGEQGTVLMTDTGNVFHRAQPPTRQDRFSISFCYTSNRPKCHWVFDRVSPSQWEEVYKRLDPSKRRYLVNRNKLLSIQM